MSKYLDVCERVALAGDAMAKAELAWEECLERGRLPAEPGSFDVWRAEAEGLLEKLKKAKDKFNTALEEFRAYLA